LNCLSLSGARASYIFAHPIPNFLWGIRKNYQIGGLGGCAKSYGQILAKFLEFLHWGCEQVWKGSRGSLSHLHSEWLNVLAISTHKKNLGSLRKVFLEKWLIIFIQVGHLSPEFVT
jgi:hypothetical protein